MASFDEYRQWEADQIAKEQARKAAANKPAPAAAPQSLEAGPPAKPIPGNVPGGQQPQPGGPAPQPPAQQPARQPGSSLSDFLNPFGPGYSPSQSMTDWGTVAGSEMPYGAALGRWTGYYSPVDLARFKAQADAARQRLGPWGSASADAIGATVNPTNLTSLIPGVGPGVAGGLQGGLTSYAQGDPGEQVRQTMARDAVLNEMTYGGAKYGLANPAFMKWAGQRAVDTGIPATIGALTGLHGVGTGMGAIGGALGAGGLGVLASEKLFGKIPEYAGQGGEWLAQHINPRYVQQGLYGLGNAAPGLNLDFSQMGQ
jgi:hypothetical protein